MRICMEEEQYSIPAMSTTDLLSFHPQLKYFQYYYSSPTINNTTADNQMRDIDYGRVTSNTVDDDNQISDINYGEVVMSNTYCHRGYPRVVQGNQYSSTPTLDVDVNYKVRNNQEDNNYELLTALINNHVENKEELEIRLPCQAATDDVSSWEWPRFGGTLESIIDQAPCLIPDLGVHVHHGNEVEEEEEKDDNQVVLLDNQEYCHMVPQALAEVAQSICNTEWMTVEEEDDNSTPPPPPPSFHSQREARKKTEKRQMQRGKSSTTIPSSSTNKRSNATIQSILHNKYERKRRSKINHRLETLQKLVPNIYKTDKASILDQVIKYVKKLQTQKDQMMNMMRLGMFDNNNMPVAVHPMMMMMPHYITTMQAMQQQQQQQYNQQMSMMTQMGMGMSMNPAGLVMMPTGSIVLPNMRQE